MTSRLGTFFRRFGVLDYVRIYMPMKDSGVGRLAVAFFIVSLLTSTRKERYGTLTLNLTNLRVLVSRSESFQVGFFFCVLEPASAFWYEK